LQAAPSWQAAAREAGWIPKSEALANERTRPGSEADTAEACTYCHGVGACPKCWGRCAIESAKADHERVQAQAKQQSDVLDALREDYERVQLESVERAAALENAERDHERVQARVRDLKAEVMAVAGRAWSVGVPGAKECDVWCLHCNAEAEYESEVIHAVTCETVKYKESP
jgi:hypothetical protein